MKRKIYEPVREFERPPVIVRCIWPGASWMRRVIIFDPIPEAFADKLAHRAEVVFAHQPSWARKATPRARSRKATPRAGSQQQFQCWRQREFILKFMRHWLAGVLAKENPALFRDLPESFKVGHPLPAHSILQKRAPLPRAERENHRQRFVHGCELLPA